MRKSPCRHKVGEYKRKNGTKVDSYYRGSGKKSSKRVSKKTVGMDDDGGGDQWEYFQVILIYDNDETEMIPVMARDADDALNLALDKRKQPKRKVKTSIVQDGLGDVVRSVVKGTYRTLTGARTRYGAAKGRVKYIAGAPERFRKSLLDEARVGEVETLIKAGQDTSKRFKAKAARDTLKKKYPGIYRSIAWKRV